MSAPRCPACDYPFDRCACDHPGDTASGLVGFPDGSKAKVFKTTSPPLRGWTREEEMARTLEEFMETTMIALEKLQALSLAKDGEIEHLKSRLDIMQAELTNVRQIASRSQIFS